MLAQNVPKSEEFASCGMIRAMIRELRGASVVIAFDRKGITCRTSKPVVVNALVESTQDEWMIFRFDWRLFAKAYAVMVERRI